MPWIDNDGSTSTPSFAFQSEKSLGWYRSAASTMALSYGSLSIPAGPNAAVIASFGASGGNTNYIMLDGLRVSGDDTANTLWNNAKNMSFTANSALTIFLGQTDSAVSGLAINTTRGDVFLNSGSSLLMNQARLISIRTQGSLDSTTLAQGELAIAIAVASGASMALRSGNTIYYWTSSASTKG